MARIDAPAWQEAGAFRGAAGLERSLPGLARGKRTRPPAPGRPRVRCIADACARPDAERRRAQAHRAGGRPRTAPAPCSWTRRPRGSTTASRAPASAATAGPVAVRVLQPMPDAFQVAGEDPAMLLTPQNRSSRGLKAAARQSAVDSRRHGARPVQPEADPGSSGRRRGRAGRPAGAPALRLARSRECSASRSRSRCMRMRASLPARTACSPTRPPRSAPRGRPLRWGMRDAGGPGLALPRRLRGHRGPGPSRDQDGPARPIRIHERVDFNGAAAPPW